MNIWIISKYASSIELGFESRIFALGRRFAKLGHSTTILTSDSNHFGSYPKYQQVNNLEIVDQIKVLRIRTLKYTLTASIKRILSWIDFEVKLFFAPYQHLDKPDVIVVSSLSLLTILNGIRLKGKFKAKLIFEIRDIWPLTMVEEAGYSESNLFVRLLGWVEKIGYKNSDYIVGTMPNLGEHVINVTGDTNLKCSCIPFGFDRKFYLETDANPTAFREKYNIPSDKFIIGYAGSIGLSNGLAAFIECIKKSANDQRLLFVLLGDGNKRKVFMSETEGQTNVLFIPKVPREEVSSFLAVCNLLYFASLKSKIWDFGWSPNKLIDYMISGKPVLASYSGFRSMINEANSGFFVPSEDANAIKIAIDQIYEMTSEQLSVTGLAGRDWVIKNRNWDHIAEEYLLLMKGLLNH